MDEVAGITIYVVAEGADALGQYLDVSITFGPPPLTSCGVATLAGQPGVPGNTDGVGRQALFSSPIGVAVDDGSNIYVADTGNHAIRQITPAGLVSTLAGSPGKVGSVDGIGSQARFNHPRAVTLDADNNLYVADGDNSTIRKIMPDGRVTTIAGLAGATGSSDGIGTAARFDHPSGLAADRVGNLYVADTCNHTLRKITPGAWVSTLGGLTGRAGSAGGTNSQARFNSPAGVAVDSAGNIYVADQGNSTIRKITPDGLVATLAGLAGAVGNSDGLGNSARFSYPAGLAVDIQGTLYVADRNDSVIRKITPDGAVSTLAGTGTEGATDGICSRAQFTFPSGLAANTEGTIFVADTFAHTIRQIRGAVVLPPVLKVRCVADQLILSWPLSAAPFVLETSPTASPSGPWTPLTAGMDISGTRFVLTNALEAPASFFRLREQ
jgi:sugar lactone lactonase YvrE